MRRREFILLIGSTAVAWPLGARAQQQERVRRIGVLMNLAEDDPEASARISAFVQRLTQLGWTEDRNLQIDYRWAAGESERYGKYAGELVALAPDVVLASGNQSVAALRQATRTLPVVFANVIDPVGSGFVNSLARPGGNVTGFSLAEFGASGKLVELLREIAPRVTRAGVLRDPISPASLGQLAAMQSVAPLVGIELTPVDVQDSQEIEHAFEAFARGPAVSGLIVPPTPMAALHRNLIISLAAQHRLPAVYGLRFYAVAGGLISYGSSTATLYQLAAEYVDRILKGEQPANLPVQELTKFELVINLKTAKALGLNVPPSLLTRADEVIE
jgi:putative tryptophan/tyrosine transport system substrate-binding protein